MTLAALCDVSYTLQVAELERHVLNERLIAATFRAAGADTEAPSWPDVLAEFQDGLNAEPEPMSESQKIKQRLGVR